MGTKSTRSSGTQHNPKGVTSGVTLVDPKSGDPIDTVTDTNGIKRLAVDGNFTAQNVQVNVELEYAEDSVSIGDDVSGNKLKIEGDGSINSNVKVDAGDGDNLGIKAQERNLSPDDTKYNKRVTAVVGSVDTDTISIDTSLHDKNGNGIDSTTNSSGRSLDTVTPDNTFTGTISSLNGSVSMSITGLSSIGFQISSGGTFVGTLIAQCSIDGGTSWKTVPFLDILNSAIYQSITTTSPNALQIFSIIPLGGSSQVRILASQYSSGTAIIVLRGSKIIGTTGQVTASAFSQVVNTFPAIPKNTTTLILAANPNRKYAYISNNSSSIVTVQFGQSTGLSAITGLVIDSNKFIEIKGDNLFTGDIYGYTGGNSVVISVTEGIP